jgi:glutamate synthase domain-containing protein 2
MAMAGGFSDEPGVFKALAMGSPYVKAVCMGRGLMIPGMVGKNIGKWLEKGELPKTVSKYGTSVEEIFVTYEELKEKFGERINEIPLGAIGIYTYAQRFKTGMQQIMAGSRNFSLKSVSRNDVFSLTEEASKISGIPYVMESYRSEAYEILDG